MTTLVVAAAVFMALHLIVSGTGVRDSIVGITGENAYLGLFSLASVVTIVWLAISYNKAQRGSDVLLIDAGTGFRHLGIPLVLLAFLIGVPGLLSPNPTSVRQEAAAQKSETVRGILRVTRHPFLWGVALWSAFHLIANGDEASVVLFGTFLVVAVLGTFSIDAKRRRKMGEAWSTFAAKTSNVPFAAIATRRTSFSAREYFDWRFLAAIVIFVGILLLHARLFGVSPLPPGMAV